MTVGELPAGDPARELYSLDPGDFTAARNALVKRLRAEGDKAEAAIVARLRRPPVTAWALNKVARQQPAVIDAVLDAGAGLRAATDDALAGDASGLRTAQAWERRALDAATGAAAGHLTAIGQRASDGARQRIAATLRAAMVDDTVAAALRDGILDDDRDAPGFGLDAFSPAAAGTAARRRSAVGDADGARGQDKETAGEPRDNVAGTEVPPAGVTPTGADADGEAEQRRAEADGVRRQDEAVEVARAAGAARAAAPSHLADAESAERAAVAAETVAPSHLAEAEEAERAAVAAKAVARSALAEAEEAERAAAAAEAAAASARADAERLASRAEHLAGVAEAAAMAAAEARTRRRQGSCPGHPPSAREPPSSE